MKLDLNKQLSKINNNEIPKFLPGFKLQKSNLVIYENLRNEKEKKLSIKLLSNIN